MYILYEYNHSATPPGQDAFYGASYACQSFTPATTHVITRIGIQIYTTENGNSATTIALYLADANDKPTGAILDSASYITTGSESNNDYIYVNLIGGIKLIAGTKYCIVATGIGDSSNYFGWKVQNENTYIGGLPSVSYDSGGSWTNYPDKDHNFREYGDVPEPQGGGSLGDKTYSKKLVAVAADEVWYESPAGTMAELTAAKNDITPTQQIDLFEAYQKVFLINGDNLKVIDFGNIKLTTDDPIGAAGVDVPDHGTVLTGGTSGAKMIVDFMTSITDGSASTIYGRRITTVTFINTETITGTDNDGNAISFVLTANEASGPHWYNWTVYGNDTSYGIMPDAATFGCLYRGRPVLAGNPDYPHQWYMMRQNNPWDLNYAANDAQAPVIGSDADAGEIGDIITALIPYKDDYLVFGCTNSIWYLSGDPAAGGSINELSLITGILTKDSWCFDGSGILYFWGTNGIYKTTITGAPECISSVALPDIVADESIDISNYRVIFSYNRRYDSIQISITDISDGSNSNYNYYIGLDAFFPESYPNSCGVCCSHFYEAQNPDYRKLVMESYDEYLRYFNETKKSDVGTSEDVAIDSYVTFGPISIGSDRQGAITSMNVILAGGGTGGGQLDSDDVTMKLFTANTAGGLLEKLNAGTNPRISKTISLPKQRLSSLSKRKLRGVYAGIRLENNAVDESWGLEKLILKARPKGRIK